VGFEASALFDMVLDKNLHAACNNFTLGWRTQEISYYREGQLKGGMSYNY